MVKEKKGAITLEACISVFAFLILMFLISGFFMMFMAQNAVAHAILEASESLSLDVYASSRYGADEGKIGSSSDYVSAYIASKLGSSEEKSPHFVSKGEWYNGDDSAEVVEAVRKRFIGYFSGGDESKAEEMLTQMRVVDGLDGLDFSATKIENDELQITVKYKLRYEFTIGNLGKVDVEQSTSSKLWK